jgi:hypothetical protein
METDPSLDGLVGAVELSGDLSDGSMMTDDLFDGGALSGKGIMALFLRHGFGK